MNTLYHGDNLTILKSLPDASVDLIATDPPFNTGKSQNGHYGDTDWRAGCDMSYTDKSDYVNPPKSWGGFDKEWHEKNKGTEWYFLSNFCTPSELYYFYDIIPLLVEIKRILKKTGALYWHTDQRTSYIYRIILNKIFRQREAFRNQIIWYYSNKVPMPNLRKRFSNNYDIILFYTPLHTNVSGQSVHDLALEYEYGTRKKMGCVWNIPSAKGRERVGYPTQKPRELYERIIKASSNQNDTVLDPFAGSGTTLDAAQTLGRQWIGVDQSDEAINVIQSRLRERHGLEYDRDYQLIPHKGR